MSWIEDQYLKWFGKGDNKVSYATKGKLSSPSWTIYLLRSYDNVYLDALSNTKANGIDQVDKLRDDSANLVGNRIGDSGLLKPVGQFASKEGVKRTERNGKDESGSYTGPEQHPIQFILQR